MTMLPRQARGIFPWPRPPREAAPPPEADPADQPFIRARPVPHPGRWVATAVLLVLAAMLAHGMVTAPGYGWGVVSRYFFSPVILSGLRLTAVLTVIAMAVGITVGILLAVMRLSVSPLVVNLSRLYIWFFRGTPLLVQLIFWYNLAALYPHLSLGIPFGPAFVSASANKLVTPLTAAIIGLGLNEGAYMAEIVRSGILSVDAGQTQAARALGMTHRLLLRRIVLPQAMRVVIPPTGNELIGMLKNTSLVSVIALAELLYSAQIVYSRNFETIPLLIVASLWYLILTSICSVGQVYLERYFGRGRVPLTDARR